MVHGKHCSGKAPSCHRRGAAADGGFTEGGFIEHLVKLNDKVQSGQKVIVQRNAFGETVAEYASPVDGEVGAIRSDTSSEPGNVLMFILFSRAPAAGDAGYPE